MMFSIILRGAGLTETPTGIVGTIQADTSTPRDPDSWEARLTEPYAQYKERKRRERARR